jgi:hypothetical protein
METEKAGYASENCHWMRHYLGLHSCHNAPEEENWSYM